MPVKIPLLLFFSFLFTTAEIHAEITFSEHIAPLVFENCSSCHRPGQAGPFSLTNYKEVRKRGRIMLEVMEDRFMPPWKPVPGHGVFANSKALSDEEISLFEKWVESDRPEGDPDKLPPFPDFPDGWQLGQPDIIVSMTEAFPVPADGRDIYRNFAIPLDLPEDKWVKAVELRPSERSVLHHVLFFLDESGRARELDGRDGKPGFSGMGFKRSGSLGSYIPGAEPLLLPGDLALPLKKGSDLVLATHFHPTGKAVSEKSTVGIYLADKPSSKTVIPMQVPPAFGAGMGINIPVGDSKYRIEDSFTIPSDVEAIAVGGHAHYVCQEMRMTATLPNGVTKPLLYIDDWDLNWQGSYLFKEPVKLPKGTVLKTEIRYNNSSSNPRNPFSPPKRIRWGKESTDEMGSITLQVVAADESDAAMIVRSTRRKTGRNLLAQAAKKLDGRLNSAGQFDLTRPNVLRLLDKNRDGRIQESEASARLRESFSQVDKNKNGTLEEDELQPVVEFLKARRKR